jgi:hypothetical protein
MPVIPVNRVVDKEKKEKMRVEEVERNKGSLTKKRLGLHNDRTERCDLYFQMKSFWFQAPTRASTSGCRRPTTRS